MPARVPTAIKRLRGTLRADRVRLHEPQPKFAVPRPSRALALDVKDEYNRLLRLLAPMRVTVAADNLSLELLAAAIAEFWRHSAVLEEKGFSYTTTTPQGSEMIRARPEVSLAADSWRRATALLREFGLTPASRGRVESAPPPPKTSKWGGLLS